MEKNPGKSYRMLKQALLDSSYQTVSGVVAGLMLLKYTEADLIKKSLKEAWSRDNGLVQLPTATTSLLEVESNTSVAVRGNVIQDGGAEISNRGFVWAEHYNPAGDDQIIYSGTGLGEFSETVSGLEEGKKYYARAFATNSAGTAYGNCVEFTASAATGINSTEFGAGFKIYPNPVTDFTTIQFRINSPEEWRLIISDLQGRIVYSKKQLSFGENYIRLNLSSFKSGVYNCTLTNGENQFSEKLLIVD